MMLTKLALIATLMAAAALAQPFVNAPLLPMYNYVEGSGYATLGATQVGHWVFTASSDGIYGMNVSAPSNTGAPFWDALPGVTQMFAVGNWTNITTLRLIAIAGPSVVAYSMNATMVWRSAWYTVQNATFDLMTDSSSQPSYMYPAFVPNGDSWMFVIGTRNTSTTTGYLPSTVFAFNPWTLDVVWWTPMNSDTTNFAPSADSEFVYVLTQNRTFGYSTVKVQKLYLVNGTLVNWRFDTTYSYLVHLRVENGQFAVLSSGGYLKIVYTSNSSVLQSDSIPTCGTMPFNPIVINGSWLFVCGSYFYAYSNTTGEQLISKYTSSNIRCGAAHEWSMNLVFVAGADVYVYNTSGVSKLVSLPSPLKSSYNGYCSGASFGWWWGGQMPQSITNNAHLSFQAYYSGYPGNMIAMDYTNGNIIAQIAANTEPLGPAIVDYYLGRVFVASTEGPILQGFDFVPIHNVTSYATSFQSTSTMRFSLAYNATNRSTYYISQSALYTVDWMGNSMRLVTLNLYQAYIQPTIVGQYLVIIDSYYNKLYVYDSVSGTLNTLSSICDPEVTLAPIVMGTKFIFFCSYSNSYGTTAAHLVDISASTLVADSSFKSKSGSNYPPGIGGAVVGKYFVIATSSSELRGFDISASPATSATVEWTATYTTTGGTVSGFYLVCSAPAAFNGNVYFTALAYSTTVGASGSAQLFRITPSSGSYTSIATLRTNSDSSTKQIVIKSGGVFGGGIMYVIGYSNITAFTTDMTMMFNYQHNGSINTAYQNNPVVLDNSGAVCFYDMNSYFNVVGGFKGALAWRYKVSSYGMYYPVLTDNSSVFFTDSQVIVGADIWSGAVTSVSSFLNGNTRGFAIAPGVNSTTVVGVTDDEVVFGNQVNKYMNSNPYFPGAGSAPSGGDGTFGGSDSKSKAWIAGVVVGVLVVIAIVVVIVKRGGGGGRTDENYVPMNPATQV